MTELLVLSGEDLRRLMRFEDYIDAVAAAFALHADGKSFAPAPVQIPGSAEGTFHIKAASLPLGPGYVAIKVNANFPQNRVTGLPTIQGAVLLFNVTNGSPLALLNSSRNHGSKDSCRYCACGSPSRPTGINRSDRLWLRKAGRPPATRLASCSRAQASLRLGYRPRNCPGLRATDVG